MKLLKCLLYILQLFICHPDVITSLKQQLDAQWRQFGTFLFVEPAIMNNIEISKVNVGLCMLSLVEKWLKGENGTGELPRTWMSVVQAVDKVGNRRLAAQLAEQHGVHLQSAK